MARMSYRSLHKRSDMRVRRDQPIFTIWHRDHQAPIASVVVASGAKQSSLYRLQLVRDDF
jgi:hypothetical protein